MNILNSEKEVICRQADLVSCPGQIYPDSSRPSLSAYIADTVLLIESLPRESGQSTTLLSTDRFQQEKVNVNPELIRDKTLDWFERLMNSPWLERACWGVIIASVLFFGPVAVRTIFR